MIGKKAPEYLLQPENLRLHNLSYAMNNIGYIAELKVLVNNLK